MRRLLLLLTVLGGLCLASTASADAAWRHTHFGRMAFVHHTSPSTHH